MQNSGLAIVVRGSSLGSSTKWAGPTLSRQGIYLCTQAVSYLTFSSYQHVSDSRPPVNTRASTDSEGKSAPSGLMFTPVTIPTLHNSIWPIQDPMMLTTIMQRHTTGILQATSDKLITDLSHFQFLTNCLRNGIIPKGPTITTVTIFTNFELGVLYTSLHA